MTRCLLSLILLFAWVMSAQAHEVRPAALSLTETAQNTFQVEWKQPVLEGRRLKITPQFPNGCEAGPAQMLRVSNLVIEQWQLSCDLRRGTITLQGLERTLTDVFIRINYLDGETSNALIKPDNPVMTLGQAQAGPTKDYLRYGVEHILAGWDHLLFVTGLVLLVSRRQILGVATSFTLAHSITLALVALTGFSLPSGPVEILIALSIVLLGVEVLKKRRGEPTLGARRPFLISFAIGLIHGFGFAGALSEIGLPQGTELLALLLFNLGVELGQFAVIAALLAALWALTKWRPRVELVTTYAMAAIGAFWVIERVSGYWV